ncbi:hypothetical protein PN466_05240 [Roseofilum reptotaenium CS-1145]|nr:hypothetical protein [Roseofilum reptotaenium CS-1145]
MRPRLTPHPLHPLSYPSRVAYQHLVWRAEPMNPENPRDPSRHLRENEEQLNRPSSPFSSEAIKGLLTKIKTWYQGLSNTGKLVVAGVSVVIGFGFLNLFLRLVTTLITLAVLGGALYLGYKFLIESDPSQN